MRKQSLGSASTGLGRVFLEALRSIFEKEGPTTAGAIAYFSLFSIFPAMILIITVCDQVLGVLDYRNKVIHTLLEVFPTARPVIMDNLGEFTTPTWPVLFVSLLTFLWSASWVFMFVENALNKAWHVTVARSFWRSRLLAMAMIILCCTLLAASVTLTLILASVQRMTDRLMAIGIMPESVLSVFWRVVLRVSSFLLTLTVFTMVYKIIPNTRVKLLEALTGAFVASVFWQITNNIFAWYTPYFFQHQKLYGSLGAVIGLLTWVYFSSLIMLYGAHFSMYMHRLQVVPIPKWIPRPQPPKLKSAFHNVKE